MDRYWEDYISEKKPKVGLNDWSMIAAPYSEAQHPYMAPEHPARQPVLYGCVTGHPLHEDGTYVTTSRLLASAGHEVETYNTVYNLGSMDVGYKKWCSSQGIEVDPEQPVKIKTA